MKRQILTSCLAISSLFLATPGLAGGDGTAGGNSGFNPVGLSSMTSIGTARFKYRDEDLGELVRSLATPNLAQALVAGGLSQAAADGVIALLLNQAVNGITPQQGVANLASELQATGAGSSEALALANNLAQLGSSPSSQSLSIAVNAFNSLVSAANDLALQGLASEVGPIGIYLTSVIEGIGI